MSLRVSPKRSLWSWFAIALCVMYAAGVAAFFALRAFLAHWPPWLSLINSAAPFLFAPLLAVLPVALLSRSRVALAGALSALALFIVLYGSCFLPRIRPVAAWDDTLTVMTCNLGFDRADPQQFAMAVQSEGADVVAVQEFLTSTVELVRDVYPYVILDPDTSAAALLSRYPILAYERFQPAGIGRTALHATLDVSGAPVHVFAIHPYPPGLAWYRNLPIPTGLDDSEQERQIADIAQRAAALEGLVLVMGDFNLSDQTHAYGRMSAVLHDAYREAGWGLGLTFPYDLQVGRIAVPGPLVRLDYIFHSDGLCAEQARVACAGGSDHCYVVARLRTRCT